MQKKKFFFYMKKAAINSQTTSFLGERVPGNAAMTNCA